MDIINVPLGWIIKICYQLTNNYAFALLLFALAMQILLLPFGIKQQKNSIKQAKLDPKVRAIRKKYAGRNDQATQQKMNNEVMELYQKEGYNPMGGCLPLLIQLPILFALFSIVTQPLTYICGYEDSAIYEFAVELTEQQCSVDLSSPEAIASLTDEQKKAIKELNYGIWDTNGNTLVSAEEFKPSSKSEIAFISDMKEILGKEEYSENSPFIYEEDGETKVVKRGDLPNLNLVGDFMDLSQTPRIENFGPLLLIPLLTLIVTFGSTFITKKFTYNPNMDAANTPSMKIMQYSMPLLSVWISFTVAGAVGLYWVFRNILSVLQQILLAKTMPIPRFTEEDYKAAEKEAKVKPEKKAKDPNKPKVRSLHRIDEDDEEDAPVKETPAQKKKISEDAPKLKDESDRNKKETEEKEDGEAAE